MSRAKRTQKVWINKVCYDGISHAGLKIYFHEQGFGRTTSTSVGPRDSFVRFESPQAANQVLIQKHHVINNINVEAEPAYFYKVGTPPPLLT